MTFSLWDSTLLKATPNNYGSMAPSLTLSSMGGPPDPPPLAYGWVWLFLWEVVE